MRSIDYTVLDLVADNYFLVGGGCCCNCGDDGCERCSYSGIEQPHEADLTTLLHNLAVAGGLALAGDVKRCWCKRANPIHRGRRWANPCCYECVPPDEMDREQEVVL